MTLWFSASALIPQLIVEWQLTASQQSWLTMSVQLGFVVGALASAIFNLPDRINPTRLIAASCAAGAVFNAAMPLLDVGPNAALVFRFFTGIALAGVYPPGMKLVASWCREDRGLGIGLLVGAITAGSAGPHLLNAIPGVGGMPPWRGVLYATSAQALIAAAITLIFVRPGPFMGPSAPFDWRFIGRALSHEPTRLANFGYLGHMWELYSMWAWVPLFLIASYSAKGLPVEHARLAAFAVIAIGGVGSVMAGKVADRLGRTRVTTWSLVMSGACALVAGLFFDWPVLATLVCLLWGFAVVADSAQFSAAVSELTDPRYIGTALTIQTSLGFLLTLLTIRIIPGLVDRIGWEYAFMILAAGPVFGTWAMQRLRRLPDAHKMASGNR